MICMKHDSVNCITLVGITPSTTTLRPDIFSVFFWWSMVSRCPLHSLYSPHSISPMLPITSRATQVSCRF